MMELFDLCSYEGDGYMQALRESYEYFDVVNYSGRFREDGQLTTSMSSPAKDALYRLLRLEYYRVHDWRKEG